MNRLEKNDNYAWWISLKLLLLAMLFISSCQDPSSNPFLKGLSLKGFEQATPLVVYNSNNIFDYINGEAEVYFPFGFQILYTQIYKKNQTDIRILVDIYDMGTCLGAKGVFEKYTQECGSEINGLGDSGWTDKHRVLFVHERVKDCMMPSGNRRHRRRSEAGK